MEFDTGPLPLQKSRTPLSPTSVGWTSESKSTQVQRYSVPITIPTMAVGTLCHQIWLLAPSGGTWELKGAAAFRGLLQALQCVGPPLR